MKTIVDQPALEAFKTIILVNSYSLTKSNISITNNIVSDRFSLIIIKTNYIIKILLRKTLILIIKQSIEKALNSLRK